MINEQIVELQKAYETAETLDAKAKALNNLSVRMCQFSLLDAATKYAEDSLSLAKESAHKSLEASALFAFGNVATSRGEFTEALEYFQDALTIYQEQNDKNNTANILGSIGNVYRSISQYTNALEYLQRSIDLLETLDSPTPLATSYGNIGGVYMLLSDYGNALNYMHKALTIDEESQNTIGVARHIGNIGMVYQDLLDYSKALEYNLKALAMNEGIGNISGMLSNQTNIGIVYQNSGDFSHALEYFQKALALSIQIESTFPEAILYGNIAVVYQHLLEYDTSLDYSNKALAASEKIGDTAGVAINIASIGIIYAKTDYKNYDPIRAEENLVKAMKLNDEIGSKYQNIQVFETLAQLYANLERWKEAQEYTVKYFTAKEEVHSEDAKKQAQRTAHERQVAEMQREQDVTERILHNILPKEIATRIRRGDQNIVESYDSVSVLFADIVDFTKFSQLITPEELVAGLDGIFNCFDTLADKHGCEKIKTIGDCYMVVAGLPERCDDHAHRLASLAIDMMNAVNEFPAIIGEIFINMRIGIHTGSVVAGIIGKNKYAYDLWGDAVNTASRMESHGEAGKIHVSEEFKHAVETLHATSLQFIRRGEINIKGKGMMKSYFLEKNI